MKKTAIYILTVLSLTVLAALGAPQGDASRTIAPGQVLQLSVTDPPEKLKSAHFALGGPVRGLSMEERTSGDLEGQFVVLPSMTGRTLYPTITYRMEDGTTRNRRLQPLRVGKRERPATGDAFFTTDESGSLLLVFQKTVQLDTVEVETRDGSEIQLRHQNNFFRLPPHYEVGDIRHASARTIHGKTIKLRNPAL